MKIQDGTRKEIRKKQCKDVEKIKRNRSKYEVKIQHG
jgi:hypothetical protein